MTYVEFIGVSWTLEYKGGYTYIMDARSESTVSLDDPICHKPNERGRVGVPQYVLKKARAFRRECERRA